MNTIDEYGCFIIDYENNLIPLYYIKQNILSHLFEIEKKNNDTNNKHTNKLKIYVNMFNELNNEEELYMVKIEIEGLPYMPLKKDALLKFVENGEKIRFDDTNININDIVTKYEDKYTHVTQAYVKNMIYAIKSELLNIYNDLLLDKYENENDDISSANISTISDDNTTEYENENENICDDCITNEITNESEGKCKSDFLDDT